MSFVPSLFRDAIIIFFIILFLSGLSAFPLFVGGLRLSVVVPIIIHVNRKFNRQNKQSSTHEFVQFIHGNMKRGVIQYIKERRDA